MTVKEIFDLRKQGKIEEAYEAIRPMYAAHKGHYTSLCMFWTASDIFKKRLDEGRIDEARQIYQAMKRMLPYVPREKRRESSTPSLPWEKSETTADPAAAFIQYAARRLGKLKTDAAPEPQREETAPTNPSDSSDSCSKKEADSAPCSRKEISAVSALSARDKDNSSDSCSSKENSAVSALSVRNKDNSSDSCSRKDISAVSAISARDKDNPSARDKEQPVVEEEPLDDLSGHLVVGLDEGMIRPAERLNISQLRVLEHIAANPGVAVPRIVAALSIPAKSVERHIAALTARHLIEHRGSKKTGGYHPIEEISE